MVHGQRGPPVFVPALRKSPQPLMQERPIPRSDVLPPPSLRLQTSPCGAGRSLSHLL